MAPDREQQLARRAIQYLAVVTALSSLVHHVVSGIAVAADCMAFAQACGHGLIDCMREGQTILIFCHQRVTFSSRTKVNRPAPRMMAIPTAIGQSS